MLGPISDVDRIIWQRQAVTVLADVLALATENAMPCVHWEVGSAKTLVARCLQPTDEGRRAAFITWARLLGVQERKAWDSEDGTHLQGSTSGFRGCTIVLIADLRLDDPMRRPGERR